MTLKKRTRRTKKEIEREEVCGVILTLIYELLEAVREADGEKLKEIAIPLLEKTLGELKRR